MQTPKRFLPALLIIAGSLAAQNPTLTGIVNASSGRPPGVPNYAIAQGSIFLIYGSNLGAAPPAGGLVNPAAMPLPTTAGLAGTLVSVTVNGTTVPAPVLFTNPSQIAAIMPSSIPTGSGTVTVTYNGKSGSGTTTVVVSAFGMASARTANGFEVAAATFGSNQGEFVSVFDSAAPGDVVIIYGTGLGPAIGDLDTTVPLTGNLGTAPSVFVGGIASPAVVYYGRSPCCAGLDQIVFTIPQNAPLGCQVALIAQTSNVGVPIVSNGPTIAIAATHHTPCADPVNEFPPAVLSSSANFKAIIVSLQQNVSVSATGTSTTSDTDLVLAAQFTPAQVNALAPTMAKSSLNSCLTGFVPASATLPGLAPATYVDIGPSLTLTPPSGAPITVPAAGPGVFQAKNSLAIPAGAWNLAAPGGTGAGPLSVSFPIPQPLVWTNQASLLASTIDRTKGLTITWTGGDANGYVDIQGFAANDTGTYLVGYDCSAPISAGTFTIPPSSLLHMPAGPAAQATLQVSTFALPFTVPPIKGFDAVANFSQLQTVIPIVYK